jgi:hypothetical protein
MTMTSRLAALQVVLVLSFCNVASAQSAGTFTPTGDMNVPRFLHTATLLTNGRVLIAGGHSTAGAVLSSAEIYDPDTGTFTLTGDMTWPQAAHTATLLPDGKVLIAGRGPTADLYDPETGTFSPAGLMIGNAFADCPSAALLNNGKVLIVFGAYSPGPTGLGIPAQLYDPVEQRFTAAAFSTIPIVDEEACPTATLLADGNVLVTWQNPAAELYQPDTNSFVPAGTMKATLEYWGYTAILLTTGNVLIAGEDTSTLAELYDPSVPRFTLTGFLNHARSRPTATLLPDGKVLTAGGYKDSSPFAVNTAEIYDSAVATFSSTGETIAPRASHTATLLMDGRVLLAGGYTGSDPYSPNSNPYSSAELYIPSVLSPPPVATTFLFNRPTVDPGSSYSVNIAGSNLGPQTFFDIRYIGPGTNESVVVLNWQLGVVGSHDAPAGTAAGVFTINGVRAHEIETDHTGNFFPVSATITVSSPLDPQTRIDANTAPR